MQSVKAAHTADELQAIIDLRYRILRQPWQQPADTASDELEASSTNAYISNGNNSVIACGRLQENAGKIGQIRYMAVDHNYQGKGLGKKILDFLEQQARAQGFVKIELQARENAVKFYEQNGYTIKEKSFLLWGLIQHYLMEKILS